jgi:hypothetical protein
MKHDHQRAGRCRRGFIGPDNPGNPRWPDDQLCRTRPTDFVSRPHNAHGHNKDMYIAALRRPTSPRPPGC